MTFRLFENKFTNGDKIRLIRPETVTQAHFSPYFLLSKLEKHGIVSLVGNSDDCRC
ncbi:hypothetical protein KDA_27740 [Dictyobacter alpinus]|uniref:Uncharacterized protein n=1 Tax=Dictyobacter alpinus TaxID=2014873 RepID=A0A402B7K9_9CHLR|nr:hypothetical protein KDA_27740 [Dictyobacter alpinus]